MEPFHSHRNARTIKTANGFTLAELLMVFAIIIIVTGVVISNQSSFNKTIILTNTAYDIALSLRSAETFGLGGHAINTTPTGYGIHFDSTLSKSFILFADSYPPASGSGCHAIPTGGDPSALDVQPGDCAYSTGANPDTVVNTYTLGNNITISKFCGTDTSGITKCTAGTNTLINSLDIVFARPNPDPLMSTNGAYSTLSPVTSACITVTSPQGGSRSVSVAASGQINANATSCP